MRGIGDVGAEVTSTVLHSTHTCCTGHARAHRIRLRAGDAHHLVLIKLHDLQSESMATAKHARERVRTRGGRAADSAC